MAGAKRQGIGKKTRFDVFKRDSFSCQYCGRKPPAVVLEVDHVIPVSSGGKNQMENLITSCFDCNRGKSDVLLSSIPMALDERATLMEEKEEQVKAYERLLKSIRRREEKAIDFIESIFTAEHEGYEFTERFRSSVRRFLQSIPRDRVEYAMEIACSKGFPADRALKYFCGVCWAIIKEGD